VNAVIVMDGDGEDRPDDLKPLMNAYHDCGSEKIIVAKREKRSEGLLFRTSYLIYKLIFKVLTGHKMGFGNFCLIPARQLSRLIYKDTLWNHFSATVLHSKAPIRMVSTERGERIDGMPLMNFTGLVIHGLSSISVFVDQVLVRTIVFLTCSMLICLFLGILGMVLASISPEFIPGIYYFDLITTAFVFLILSLVTYVLILSLSRRSQKMVIPAEDIEIYIKNVETAFDRQPDT
ncbi:MAG: glycosyl transferase family 2, partial [Gammaproteobacteria bacterium]|nr:glycosyl transferase family 2 [Gammaproteobacteria bacterium]